jgi:alkylated DNA repair dioxygenase AlkB
MASSYKLTHILEGLIPDGSLVSERPPIEEKETLIETGTSSLWIVEDFYSGPLLDSLTKELLELPLAENPPITIFGRECKQARDVAHFSDVSSGYKYSGAMAKATSMEDFPVLRAIMGDVNKYLEIDSNGILVNRYNDGNATIGAHRCGG